MSLPNGYPTLCPSQVRLQMSTMIPQLASSSCHIKAIYMLCAWGFGHLVISPDRIDLGFGLRFVIRRANPRQVRSLTIHTMDTLARTARTTIPRGREPTVLRNGGGRGTSRPPCRWDSSEGLTGARGGDNDFVTVRGADGLSIPLGREQSGLLNDIQCLQM